MAKFSDLFTDKDNRLSTHKTYFNIVFVSVIIGYYLVLFKVIDPAVYDTSTAIILGMTYTGRLTNQGLNQLTQKKQDNNANASA